MNDQSAVPAMATGAIGEGGMALIRAKSPNGVSDHIRKLRSIVLLALTTGKDHVAGVAHVELSRIAVGLAAMQTRDSHAAEPVPGRLRGLGGPADAFISRVTSPGGYEDDWAWMSTTAPHMDHNLSRVVTAGIAADARRNVHVMVPAGSRVEISGLALFGIKRNEVSGDATAGGPVVRVQAWALFGDVKVV